MAVIRAKVKSRSTCACIRGKTALKLARLRDCSKDGNRRFMISKVGDNEI